MADDVVLPWLTGQKPVDETAPAAGAPAAPVDMSLWAGQQPVAETPDTLRRMAPYDWENMAAHGLSFGAIDPLRAAAKASIDWVAGDPVSGEPVGFDYQKRAEEIAGARRHYEAQHPYLSTAANLGGALLSAPLLGATKITAAAPSMISQIAKSLGFGTTAAAVTGAADNPENPLMGAATYAPFGAAAGTAAPLVMRAGGAVGRGVANWMNPAGRADLNAANQLRSIVESDTSVGHPDVGDLNSRLLGGTGAPLSLTDISPGTQRYVGSLYNTNTPASTLIGKDLKASDTAAQSRILAGLDRTVGTGPETFEAEALLKASQKAKAAPLYGDAYMQPPVNPDLVAPGGELHSLIATPAGQQAMRNAEKIAAQERVPTQSRGITFNEAGDPVFTGVPSWKTLDYVKRGFDDVLNGYPRDPFTGKRELDTYGRAVAQTLSEYRDAVVRENPAYGKALSVYSGDQASLNALNAGRHAMAPGLSAPEHEHIFNQFTPGDQELYRLAHANDLRFKIRSTTDLGDETKRIANSTDMRDKLKTLFDTPAEHSYFVDNLLGGERTKFETGYNIMGGSPTAFRQGTAPQASPSILPQAVMAGGGALVGGAGPVGAVATGAGAVLTKPLANWLSRISEKMAGQSPEAQLAAARLALEPGGRNIMGLLQAPQMRRAMPPWLTPDWVAATQPTTLPSFLGHGLLGLPEPERQRR